MIKKIWDIVIRRDARTGISVYEPRESLKVKLREAGVQAENVAQGIDMLIDQRNEARNALIENIQASDQTMTGAAAIRKAQADLKEVRRVATEFQMELSNILRAVGLHGDSLLDDVKTLSIERYNYAAEIASLKAAATEDCNVHCAEVAKYAAECTRLQTLATQTVIAQEEARELSREINKINSLLRDVGESHSEGSAGVYQLTIRLTAANNRAASFKAQANHRAGLIDTFIDKHDAIHDQGCDCTSELVPE